MINVISIMGYPASLLRIVSCRVLAHLDPLDSAPALDEGDLEEHVGILEEALLQTYYYKLAVLKELPNHDADVLSVGEIQSRINFVEDVERGWVVLEQS